MCGIAGFVSFSKKDNNYLKELISTMTQTLFNRGPDSSDVWFDNLNGVAFGHRRLAIQDLSPAGNQPMEARSRRYMLVFNGEIYNHLELRKQLKSCNWIGHSDTETILACVDAWGVEVTLKKLTGMFSIALWDKKLEKLFLARDRLGEKPLYYANHDNCFIFGSELKAIKKHSNFIPEIDRNALCLYLRHSCIPAPYCIYKNTYKLMPGTMLVISRGGHAEEKQYWSATEVINQSTQNRFTGSANQAVDELGNVLTKAVNRQVISDVPLGAFLSGGIDSTTVVALMQAHTSKPVKTFTIGFENKDYNEAEHAKSVAKHLGTDHTEMYLSPNDVKEVIPSLSEIYDEPFADSSQIPTYLVAKLAKTDVTVALSGDGGDELFAGYNRHKLAQKLWPKVAKIPFFMRGSIAKGINKFSPTQLDTLGCLMPKSMKMRLLGDKLIKAARVMSSQDDDVLYRSLVSNFDEPSNLVLGGMEPCTILTSNQLDKALSTPEKMMALDMMTYMGDDILTKVDRAAMAVSLETRVPMLDHSVVEFAWQLPMSIKLRDGLTKWPLRQLLYKHVPKELVERPKMGFALPIGDWLRGSLRGWASELLNPIRLQKEGYFNELIITELWQEHLSGIKNNAEQLWCILMFQAWLEAQ